jgi:hypothetical protein
MMMRQLLMLVCMIRGGGGDSGFGGMRDTGSFCGGIRDKPKINGGMRDGKIWRDAG